MKRIFLILIAAGLLAGLVLAFLAGHKEAAAEAEREKPIKAPTRVDVVNGENVVTFDPATQASSGVALAPLAPLSHRPQISAYGAVLDLQELTDLDNAIASAQAQLGKAQAAREVARADYDRVKALYGKDQNVSQKVVQAAEGALQAEVANVQIAQASLHAAGATAVQHWGSRIAGWLAQGAPELDRLRSQQSLLVQVTLAPGQEGVPPPPTASLQTADGRLVPATLVSPAPRTDPKIQGQSFFYIFAGAGANLLPGMNITALLPVGEPAPGVVVPDSAVVWLQGTAWVYTQVKLDRFARRKVSTAQPVPGGWFQPQDFSTGEPFVVKGPQVLLSEEFRARISVGEEND